MPGGGKQRKKVHAREIFSAGWVIVVTFIIGIPIIIFQYGEYHQYRDLALFLYIFLEFLPMLFFLSSVSLPHLSPHLLLPWIVINILLLLLSSILVLSLSISRPTLANVLISLAISLFIIFPISFVVTMYLPLVVYVKKLVPNYKRKIKRSKLYRVIFRKKTAEEMEKEIIWRRKEQVRNTIITDRDYEQFIYVNRAAKKWKSKLKSRQTNDPTVPDVMALEEERNPNITSQKLDTVYEEALHNGDVTGASHEALIDNEEVEHPEEELSEKVKLVTDV